MKTRIALLAAGLLAAGVSITQAAPVIDGRFDAGEGYTHVTSVAPNKYDVGKNPGDPSTMYLSQDPVSKNLSVAVLLPKTYVDNSYGTKSVGWSGKTHKFDELVGSDKAEFVVNLSGTKKLEFALDYLYQDKTTKAWDSGVAGNEGYSKPVGGISASATSMDYNLHLPGGLNYTVDSPNLTSADYYPSALPDWVFDVTYEFEIPGSVFGGVNVLGEGEWLNGFQLFWKSVHASPNKGAEFKYIIPPPPSTIPEPASAGLLALGAAGFLLRRRR